MLVRLWRKGNPSALLVGMQTGEATVENSMEFPQKPKMELPFDPVIPLLGLHPKDPETPIKQNLYKQNPETVVHLHNGILYSRKEEGTPTLHDSMDGTREYYAMRNKPGDERQYHIIPPISRN